MTKKTGTVIAIAICPTAGAPMQSVDYVEAIQGQGLRGDRYCLGEGSWNKRHQGRRQVTLVNAEFIPAEFPFIYTRRNIAVQGIELMDQIGYPFCIDKVQLRGIKYCYPCMRPAVLAGSLHDFEKNFHDRGGLIAEVLDGGPIRVGSVVCPRSKTW